jgi:hypothetical protein
MECRMNSKFLEVGRDTFVKIVFASLCAANTVLVVVIVLH